MINIKFSAVFYQRILIRASLDDVNGFNILAEKNHEEMPPPVRWREHYFVADFVYRNLQSGLIERVKYGEMPGEDESNLCMAEKFLATPFDNNSEDSLVLWNAVNFRGTSKLLEILGRHGLLEWGAINGGVGEGFIGEIIDIYRSYGLGDVEFSV